MDEQSSSEDASVRGSLVDSRRLLFEKYVTEQASRPEGGDQAAAVIRQNGRLPRSSRAAKVTSWRDVPQSPTSDEAPAARRRSHDDQDLAEVCQPSVPSAAAAAEPSPVAAADATPSPATGADAVPSPATVAEPSPAAAANAVPSPAAAADAVPSPAAAADAVPSPAAAADAVPSPVAVATAVPSSAAVANVEPSPAAAENADQAPPSLPASQTAAPAAASETSPPSGERISLVPPPDQYHFPEGELSASAGSPMPAVLCQSSADTSPPNCSKRISYHHAVLNGAKQRLAATSIRPDAVPETSLGDVNHSVGPDLPDSPHFCDGESLSATSKRSSAEDLVASTNSGRSSLNSSSRETCEPVVVETTNDQPVPTDDGDSRVPSADIDAVIADSNDVTGSAVTDKTTVSAVTDKATFPAVNDQTTYPTITNSSDEPAASDKSAVPVVATRPAKPAVRSKPVKSVIKCKPIRSSSPVTVPAVVTVDYPEDLNPFGDDDDEDKNDVRKSLENSRVAVNSEHDSTNPFGSDSDEDDDANASKSTAPSTNPFWSGSEEDSEDDQGSASRTPVPLPRKKPIASPSPQPSPRPRPRVTATGCSSSEISPTSSCRKSSADSAEFRPSTNSIFSTPRKKKPAPPPPPSQAKADHSGSNDEKIKNSTNEQTKTIDSVKINLNDSNLSVSDLKEDATKKVVSPWKNKKRPAPARPTPLRRPVKEMPLEDIKVELEDIEIRYQELVRQAAQLEEKIHIKRELESADSSGVEEMVVLHFEVVNEKNELFRRRSELVNMRKMYSLEVEQADIEYQIRCIMLRPESNKTDSDKASEEALLKRLVEVVEKRNEIIDLMDKDRLRETVEDESVTTQLEPKSKKEHRSKEKKKKGKKDKNKEPEDSDKHSPSKLIKQKFMTLRHTAKKLHPKLPD